MKKQKIGSLKDGAKFKVSPRKTGLVYKIVGRIKGLVVYTSTTTEYSSADKASKLVYPC